MAVVELENVEKSYGKHRVLKGVNLAVEKGEIYGLLGPNGAGKTTLFQIMTGLLKEDSGEIRINGRSTDGKQVKRVVGYLPSDISFYDSMTAVENLQYLSRLADKEPDIEGLLQLVDLEEDRDRKVGDYSTGMKKRLGIAQALIKEPEIAIFDEPTTGLDPEGKNSFRKQVEKINQERDMTVIISSHITGEISPLCDRFGILTKGVIKASGTKEELTEKTGSSGKIQLKVENPGEAAETLEKYEFERDGKHFEVEADDYTKIVQQIVNSNAGLEEFSSEASSLESLYLELTR
ncbi:MAG: ABC transporter ATP-binding protein [Candidatus Nanohaloarchaea archaeon]